MRVAFDTRPATDVRGIGCYARCLLDALRASGRGQILESTDLQRCDVFHSPSIDGALLRSPVPMVVTLHDLAPLKRRTEYLRSGIRFRLRYLAVQRAVRVIVPTNAIGRDAVEVLEIPSERITVIPEAAAPAFRPRPADEVAAVRDRFDLPPRYLVCIGGLQSADPRKRVAALSRVSRTMPLVLVGPTGRWTRRLADVTLTGAVSDDELAAIYTGAHALVLPNDEVGFGLAPVEALSCGTPVAACDLPGLRELLDGRAAFSAVDDLDALIANAETACRPAPAPPSWGWSDAAAATWDVYEQAASAPARWRGARRRRSAAGV